MPDGTSYSLSTSLEIEKVEFDRAYTIRKSDYEYNKAYEKTLNKKILKQLKNADPKYYVCRINNQILTEKYCNICKTDECIDIVPIATILKMLNIDIILAENEDINY